MRNEYFAVAAFILWSISVRTWAARVAEDKHTIRMKDVEFVGDDPVLMAELTRRMPDLSRGGAGAVRPVGVGAEGEDRDALIHQVSEVVDRSGASDLTSIQGRRKEDRSYKPFIYQPDDGVVGTFALQMIEQAIYSIEYRLKEVDPYVQKYNKDVRFRIGYIFKQLERWIYEMEVMYSYITYAERKNEIKYNIFKNMIYYTQLVKRNFDITYTIYHLLKLHTDFVILLQEVKDKGPGPGQEGFQSPGLGDMDMSDPAVVAQMKDMMTSDRNH